MRKIVLANDIWKIITAYIKKAVLKIMKDMKDLIREDNEQNLLRGL